MKNPDLDSKTLSTQSHLDKRQPAKNVLLHASSEVVRKVTSPAQTTPPPVPVLTATDRALRLPEVSLLTQKSKTVIYVDMKAGRFPKGFKIGLKARAWSLNEINEWLENRKQERG